MPAHSQTKGRGSTKYLKNQLLLAHKTVILLRLQLMREGTDSVNGPPAWAKSLTPQEFHLAVLLLAAHPHYVSRGYLNDNLLKADHAKERCASVIDKVVCVVRKSFGFDAIETVWGHGFRCSDAFAARYKSTLTR